MIAMTVGKPVSRMFVEEHQSTINTLVERGWLENTLNDVIMTELRELTMLLLSMRIIFVKEFPDYNQPRIDHVTSKAITDHLNTWGYISTHKINGMECIQLADEGTKACIRFIEGTINSGDFEELISSCNEDYFKHITIRKINSSSKKKR